MKNMRVNLKKWLTLDRFDVFSLLIFIILIFTINYAMGSYVSYTIDQKPFGLSKDAVTLKLQNKNSLPYSKMIDLKKYNKIRIIATTKNKEVIGLFDPDMYYYVNATKVVLPIFLRYFSKDDYIKKANVSIAVNQCPLDENKMESMNYIGNEYDTKVINCLESSPLMENDAVLIKNLFSIPNQLGDIVYIDGSDLDQLRNAHHEFKKNGYIDIYTNLPRIGIFKSLSVAYQSKYPKFLITTAFTLIILFIVVCFSMIDKNKSKIYIGILNGGNFGNILYHMHFIRFLKNLILCCISSFLIIGYLEKLNNNFITNFNLLKIIALYLMYEVFIYTTICYLSYKKVDRKGR